MRKKLGLTTTRKEIEFTPVMMETKKCHLRRRHHHRRRHPHPFRLRRSRFRFPDVVRGIIMMTSFPLTNLEKRQKVNPIFLSGLCFIKRK